VLPRFKNGRRGSTLVIGFMLCAITLAVYWQVGNHQFLNFDDNVYVTGNPHVTGGITGRNIVWAFTSVDAGNWHPLTWLSHMTDAQLFGMDPRGHHLTNVVLHALSTLLLLLLLIRLTGQRWHSAFVAALFALHPLHVESVAWVAERKDVLSGLFWFLTLLLYAEFVRKRKTWMYLLSLCSFVLGLMAKPMLVTLPVVMLLLDFWPFARYGKEKCVITLFKEKIPFFLCSLLSVLVTIYAQNKGGAIGKLSEFPFAARCQNALVAYATYIGKTLWPHNLAVYYPFPVSIPLWQVIGSLLLLTILSVAAIKTRNRQPYLVVGWFWFIITLLPVIGLIQVGDQSMADRYSYIPLIGLFIVAAWGCADAMKNLPYRKSAATMLAGAVILASAAVTWQQLGYWRDSSTLYRHDLRVTTGNNKIHYNLGLALQAEGDLDGAIQNYQEALRINPSMSDTHNNLGVALQAKGYLDPAIREYQAALRINPDYINAHINLGALLYMRGELDAAIDEYRKALLINPDDTDAHYNLGIVFHAKGNPDGAIQVYREVLRKDPNHVKAYSNLGSALAQQGDLEGAIRSFQEALKISPDDSTVKQNLELALTQKRMRSEAHR
jgi:tetratricopeptide (TPR) repeat protein